MHFSWQAQYKRHLQQRCSELKELISWEGLHFGVSNHQLCQDAFSWQVQHFVWPGLWQAQYFRDMAWKNRKTHWYEAVSCTVNFPFLNEVSQNCFVFDVFKCKKWESLAELLRFWCCQQKSSSIVLLSTWRLDTLIDRSRGRSKDRWRARSMNTSRDKSKDGWLDRETDRSIDR